MKINKSDILIIGILAFLYYFMAEMRSQLLIHTNIVSTLIFPSEGIALAFALYFGKRVWPGIFIGQFFIAYGNGLDIATSLSIATINSLEAVLAVTLFQKFKLNNKLEHFRDIIGLSLLIVFILQPFSALTANGVLLYFGHIETNTFLSSSFSWWFGNIMGQFLFAPLLLLLFHSYKKIKITDFILLNMLFAFYISILIYLLNIHSSLLLLSLTLPILLYIVYSKTAFYALSMVTLMSYIISFFMSYSIGPFLFQDKTIDVVDYNLYLLTLTLTILTVRILFENNKKQEKILQQRIQYEIEKNKEQQFLLLHQSRLAQMGEMIAMIAHQWRQPLNNLSLLHQLVISKYKKNKLDDTMIEYFRKNTSLHTNMMAETINDFKNFFKPEEAKEKFNLNELILSIINIINPSLQKEKIKIIFFAQDSYNCLGYKNSLGHALLNIINNARDALQEQEIQNKKIEIEIIDNESELTICIRDNGGGIPETIIEKIFDPYFSTKEEKNGTGLGLYMTNMIITEHMDGKIYVKNDYQGAVFQIILKGELCERTT
jgi:signal transduction histidine kinase